jgi:hypothetical protein
VRRLDDVVVGGDHSGADWQHGGLLTGEKKAGHGLDREAVVDLAWRSPPRPRSGLGTWG